jgi:hypothetical protein
MADSILLARRQLRQLVVAALAKLTTPGVDVQDSPDWPTPPEKLPAVLVSTGRERKEGLAKSMPNFTTLATVQLEARIEGANRIAARDGIEALCYDIENTLLCSHDLVAFVQRVASIDTEMVITAEGKRHIGAAKLLMVCEMFEAFDPTQIQPLNFPALQSMGVHLDLTNVFDPSGTYPAPTAPPYTPTAAPRTAGPDGRDEGALDITLPQ